jgi:hypothetical protein
MKFSNKILAKLQHLTDKLTDKNFDFIIANF